MYSSFDWLNSSSKAIKLRRQLLFTIILRRRRRIRRKSKLSRCDSYTHTYAHEMWRWQHIRMIIFPCFTFFPISVLLCCVCNVTSFWIKMRIEGLLKWKKHTQEHRMINLQDFYCYRWKICLHKAHSIDS